jgi:hypothetical protein
MLSRHALWVAAATLAMSASLLGQSTISVNSGLIQYTSGAVTVGDQPVHKTTTNILSLKKDDVLATGADGAAEVLMTPGVFVRMVGEASLRMDSISLADTRVTVLTGSVMVECVELIKDDHVTFFVSAVPGSPAIEVRKPSLFRIDATPPQVSVVQGEVFAAGVTVTKNRTLALNAAVLHAEKFKLNKQEDLYMFSEARSADSAYASNVASHSLYAAGGTCFGSSWYFMNPVSMYAYLPCNGFNNFFGYPFFGVNYGYMYGGIPYYYPPPIIFCGSHGCPQAPPKQQNPNTSLPGKPPVAVSSNGVGLASNAVRMASLLSNAAASPAAKPANGLMKVPAFTGVTNTQPTFVTVSRASYLANLPQSGGDAVRSPNMNVLGPMSGGQTSNGRPASSNRYMAATSLSASHAAASGSNRGAGASFGGGASSGGTHYSGGGTVSSGRSSSSGGFVGGGGAGGGFSGASRGSSVGSVSSSSGSGHK